MKETHSQAHTHSNTRTHMRNPQWTGFSFQCQQSSCLCLALLTWKIGLFTCSLSWLWDYVHFKLHYVLQNADFLVNFLQCHARYRFLLPFHIPKVFFFWLFHAFSFDKVKWKKWGVHGQRGCDSLILYLTINRPFSLSPPFCQLIVFDL